MQSGPTKTRASLILRLQNAGDVTAWDEFVELYGRVLYRTAVGRGLQSADAENLVQEVLFAVARSVSKWLERPDRGSFRAWLLFIARNEAADILERQFRRSAGGENNLSAEALNAVPAPDEISHQLDREHERVVFQWAAEHVRSSVAPQTWQAFWLTHMNGLSIEEAAQQLQTRTANIYFGRSRVMARIKDLVERYEERS
ncbi:MAG: RNA polymerase sigma factor [Planctomyces sp.]|nr:RNA polymerase sigma factor [Planctomyces sp.]